jgi:hypothetical protein
MPIATFLLSCSKGDRTLNSLDLLRVQAGGGFDDGACECETTAEGRSGAEIAGVAWYWDLQDLVPVEGDAGAGLAVEGIVGLCGAGRWGLVGEGGLIGGVSRRLGPEWEFRG